MKINRYILLAIIPLIFACGGGGGGPTAPVIVPPDITSGGGTATGPTVPVAANPATFDIAVTTDMDTPIMAIQLKVTFQPALVSTVPTVSIASGLFDVKEAKFHNEDETTGILYILLSNSANAAVTGPGPLCTITFINGSGAGSQNTTISFSGSLVEYQASEGSFSPLVIDSVDVTLG